MLCSFRKDAQQSEMELWGNVSHRVLTDVTCVPVLFFSSDNGWYIHPALLILSLILPYNRPNHLYFAMCPISFDGSVGGDCSKSTKSQQVREDLWLCASVTWHAGDFLLLIVHLTNESVRPCMFKKYPSLSASKTVIKPITRYKSYIWCLTCQ